MWEFAAESEFCAIMAGALSPTLGGKGGHLVALCAPHSFDAEAARVPRLWRAPQARASPAAA